MRCDSHDPTSPFTYNAPWSTYGFLPALKLPGRESYQFTVTLNARRVILEKTHGIWKGWCDTRFPLKLIRNPGAAGRITCKSTITLNARRNLFEKTQRNLGRLVQRAFSLKNRRVGGGGSSVAYKFSIKMKPRHIFFAGKRTISPGWAGMTCKFSVKMKPRRILHEKTAGFLRSRREWHVAQAHFTWENTKGVGGDWGAGVY